jgi:peptidoglycan/xylan/chitin deacetylase (PgdA/CDA1 family)
MSPGGTDGIADAVCLTIDVDWACSEVLADMVRLLDERNLRATFFCTHAGIEVPGHERAIHPNFRHRGDTTRRLRRERGDLSEMPEPAIYEYVVRKTLEFCPEARGVRGHSLLYDSLLLPIYHAVGIEYDSSYLLPLTPGLHPVYKEYNLLEIPIYANDHFLLKIGAKELRTSLLKLDRPGLKVCQFHPNMVFLNAATDAHYQESRADYHDAERLRRRRHTGRGVRDLFVDLLDALAGRRYATPTLGEVNMVWRASQTPPW